MSYTCVWSIFLCTEVLAASLEQDTAHASTAEQEQFIVETVTQNATEQEQFVAGTVTQNAAEQEQLVGEIVTQNAAEQEQLVGEIVTEQEQFVADIITQNATELQVGSAPQTVDLESSATVEFFAFDSLDTSNEVVSSLGATPNLDVINENVSEAKIEYLSTQQHPPDSETASTSAEHTALVESGKSTLGSATESIPEGETTFTVVDAEYIALDLIEHCTSCESTNMSLGTDGALFSATQIAASSLDTSLQTHPDPTNVVPEQQQDIEVDILDHEPSFSRVKVDADVNPQLTDHLTQSADEFADQLLLYIDQLLDQVLVGEITDPPPPSILHAARPLVHATDASFVPEPSSLASDIIQLLDREAVTPSLDMMGRMIANQQRSVDQLLDELLPVRSSQSVSQHSQVHPENPEINRFFVAKSQHLDDQIVDPITQSSKVSSQPNARLESSPSRLASRSPELTEVSNALPQLAIQSDDRSMPQSSATPASKVVAINMVSETLTSLSERIIETLSHRQDTPTPSRQASDLAPMPPLNVQLQPTASIQSTLDASNEIVQLLRALTPPNTPSADPALALAPSENLTVAPEPSVRVQPQHQQTVSETTPVLQAEIPVDSSRPSTADPQAEERLQAPPDGASPDTAGAQPTPATANTVDRSSDPSVTKDAPIELGILPVSIQAGSNEVADVLVHGAEDGVQAVNFDQWLLPFNTVLDVLQLETTTGEDGRYNIQGSEGKNIQIDPSTLQTSPEVGPVLSIADIKARLGVTEAKFDLLEYRLSLEAPWLNQRTLKIRDRTSTKESLPTTEGLPKVKPSDFALSALQQRIDLSRSGDRDANISASLLAVGTLWGNSWYIEVDQRDLTDPSTWGLGEFQIVRLTPKADFYVGTQQPFWPENNGDILGVTSTFRFNYTPPERSLGVSPNLDRRLQTSEFRRTISGRAAPGTLVQLRAQGSRRVIEEILVDDSGVYRFTDLEINPRRRFQRYQVYLFTDGKLDNTPEIRNVRLAGALTGQLPAGSTAVTVSVGRQRQFAEFDRTTPFGQLEDWVGGISALWGVSSSLTIGGGVAYDNGPLGFGEVLWQPNNLPVNASLALSTGNDETPIVFEGRIFAQPTEHLSLNFIADELSRRLDIDWSILPGLSLAASYDSEFTSRLRLGYSKRFKDVSFSTGVAVDTEQKISFRQSIHWKNFNLRGNISNDGDAYGELEYNLSSKLGGHSIKGSFDQNDDQRLGVLEWNYRSRGRSFDGGPIWQASLGYGMGDAGSGLLASVETAIIPGLSVRASYEQVSRSSSEDRFSLNIISSFETQKKIRPGSRRSFGFRTRGGLLIEPFLDTNQNGKLDSGEERFADPNLVVLNNKPLKSADISTAGDVYRLQIAPGVYRVDLDPSGYPIDWQAAEKSFAVEIAAGSYTSLLVPLIPSYSVTGTITRQDGKPLRGARVEAVDQKSGHRVTSITDRTGAYYLDGLRRSTYHLQINGKPSTPGSLTLDKESETYFQLDLSPGDANAADTPNPPAGPESEAPAGGT